MAKLSVPFAFAISTTIVSVAFAQPPVCTLSTPAPPGVAANGTSELVEDVVMTCVSTAPSESTTINVTLTLNVNLTSRITNTTTLATESLLLIDDPKPGVANVSNGFPYFGQVLGTPGVLAGVAGSGNVYQGMQATSGGVVLENQVVFLGVPYVTGGTRTFRLVNTRADVAAIGINPVNADVAVTSDFAIEIANPVITVALGKSPLNFTSGPIVGAVGLELSFAELFPRAFKKRLENLSGGPLTLNHQDVPGTSYCTESGFTPGYESLVAHAVGFADTGTRLLAVLQSIPPAVTSVSVPNQVPSLTGDLVAHLVLPPLGARFAAGTVTTATGNTTFPIGATHSLDLLYDVTAASPYLGINGCGVLDTFNVVVFPTPPMSISATVAAGYLAPIDSVGAATATDPEPRFVP